MRDVRLFFTHILSKKGNIPKALAVATIPPQADIPSAKWSVGNRVLQFLADTSDARGFRQWQNAGRKVKKGAKAFCILGPNSRVIKETDDNGEKIEKTIVTGFHAIPVFRAEDTDGEPLPYEPATPPPLVDVATDSGSRLTIAAKLLSSSRKSCGASAPSSARTRICASTSCISLN